MGKTAEMPRIRLSEETEELRRGFKRIRDQMDLPRRFPEQVQEEVRSLPDPKPNEAYADGRDIDFVTIDPKGSRDLDQAFQAEPEGNGYLVRYAIADVGFFVKPGSGLDRESHRRGQTLYCPDTRIPLYPPELSEGAASLLPDADRPAVLWTFHLEPDGRVADVEVTRATVRSRRQMTYAEAQQEIDSGVPGSLSLLKEVGGRRQKLEQERGAVSLHVPEQEVVKVGFGYKLSYRVPLPVEDWNAQISLMTGMAGADIMLKGKVGLLRTMPAPPDEAVEKLRRSARALELDWPSDVSYADFVRTLDLRIPAHAAIATQSTQLFRGVAYAAFQGKPPVDAAHHAIAAPYAHVTAPLRRMADRYTSEIVLSLVRGEQPPAWCTEALAQLPEEMKEADRRDGELERRIIDLVEVVVLANRVGELFDAVVVDVGKRGGQIQLRDPAVQAPCDGEALELGSSVKAKLITADPEKGQLRFQVMPPG